MLKAAEPDYGRIHRQYMDAVRSGERIAGEMERAAVRRFLADRKRENTDEFPYVFSETLADRACRFFGLLRHSDREYHGQPFRLYPWQVFIVRNLFGWVHRETHYRRFTEAYITVGRGNGKTPFGAAIMLLLFAADHPFEHRAEVYTAAVKREQAGKSFRQAKRYVEASPSLQKKINVFSKELTNDSDSRMEALSSDSGSADGHNIHGLLRDELHEWSEYMREYYDKLETGLKGRQPMAITITTAGSEKSLLWKERYGFACQVVDQDSPVNQESLFVAIYEIDADDDELDEQVWPKANPMLEFDVVKIDRIRKLAEEAKVNTAKRHALRRYHCNRLAYTDAKSFTADLWAKGDQPIPVDELGDVYLGIDIGIKDDLAGLGVVAPLDWVSIEGKSKRRYAVWCEAWIPAGTNRNLNHQPFRGLIESGRLVKTDSEWTDFERIYEEVEQLTKEYNVRKLAYDPAQAREFALNCVNEYGIEAFAFQQQHKHYNEPLQEFQQALLEGRILHGNDVLLGWTALNVVEDRNTAGHAMPSKDRSQDKIDPFVAVLMAFSECLFAERTKPKTIQAAVVG